MIYKLRTRAPSDAAITGGRPESSPPPCRVVVVAPTQKEEPPIVRALVRVRPDTDPRQRTLERAWREIEEWRQRYAGYPEFATIFSAIDEARARR